MATRRTQVHLRSERTEAFYVSRELAESVPSVREWANARAFLQVSDAEGDTPMFTLESSLRADRASSCPQFEVS